MLAEWLVHKEQLRHYIVKQMGDYRSHQAHDELIDNQVVEELPQEQVNLQEIGQCLRPMLDCLPVKYREAMILSELEGFSQQAVADQLGLSLSGTKSRIQRGRTKLKEILLNCCNMEVGREGILDFYPSPECEHMVNERTAFSSSRH